MSTRKQDQTTQTQPSSTKNPAPPFSVHLLADHSDRNDQLRQPTDRGRPHSLLPASYRGRGGDVIATCRDITACIAQELDLHRLSDVYKYLWVAGLPLPPRALHHQLLLGREIIITERMDMHLVWMTGRIFLKPLPRFLLEPIYWSEYLSCEDSCGCDSSLSAAGAGIAQMQVQPCESRTLRRRALGFLYSYTALLSHESDFRIAHEKHLLPPEVQWASWRTLVDQLLDVEHLHSHIDRRFIHGELRLSRLNKIYSLYQTPTRGYLPSWDRYGAFFQYHFAWVASAIAYIAIVLTAMQVGLATVPLSQNKAFQSASYGFTVFSILGPLVVAAMILLYFCGMFVLNWEKTVRRNKDRLSKLDGGPS